MKVVGVRAGEVVGLEAFDVLGLDDEDVFAGLKFAGDLEEVFLCNDKPQLFKKLGFDDGVADAGFVLEADEDKSLRRPGPLPADDVAGNFDDLSFLAAGEVNGAPDIFQLRTQ